MSTRNPSTSFLRILNLYNESATPEMDPIKIYHNSKPNVKVYHENNNYYNNHKSKLRDLLRHPYG